MLIDILDVDSRLTPSKFHHSLKQKVSGEILHKHTHVDYIIRGFRYNVFHVQACQLWHLFRNMTNSNSSKLPSKVPPFFPQFSDSCLFWTNAKLLFAHPGCCQNIIWLVEINGQPDVLRSFSFYLMGKYVIPDLCGWDYYITLLYKLSEDN